MATPQDNPQEGRTWQPILLGVACGMIALCLLAKHEPAAYWHLTAWVFSEEPPAKLIDLFVPSISTCSC